MAIRAQWILALCVAVVACGGERPPPASPAAAPSPPSWSEVERLQKKRQFEAARAQVDALLAAARAAGDDAAAARALLRGARLRTAIAGYPEALRFLRSETWPADPLARATLHSYAARTWERYARHASWDVWRRSQSGDARTLDPTRWTWHQLHQAAEREMVDLWALREPLGAHPADALGDVIELGTWPRPLRPTLRDVVSYLWVERLTDRRGSFPEHRTLPPIEVGPLLTPDLAPPELDNPLVQPERKAAGVLADLEAWHCAEGRAELAFLAFLARLELLHRSTSEPADHALIAEALAAALPAARDHAGWSMGMGALAQMRHRAGGPDAAAEALALAEAGAAAYPESLGAARCGQIIRRLRPRPPAPEPSPAPRFELKSTHRRALGDPSLAVTHRGVARVSFRAWRVDPRTCLTDPTWRGPLPGKGAVARLIETTPPDAAWTLDLAAAPDDGPGPTTIIPPVTRPGVYAVDATPELPGGGGDALRRSTSVVLGDPALLHRGHGTLDVLLVSGATGAPLADRVVGLYREREKGGCELAARATTDAVGHVHLVDPEDAFVRGFLLTEHGDEVALGFASLGRFDPEPPTAARVAVLVYTDRTAYRPGQAVQWKVIAYRGGGDDVPTPAPDTSLTVHLQDTHGEVVQTAEVTTNARGTASGRFDVPAGRVAGQWIVRAPDHPTIGGAVRVEVHDRPRIAVHFVDADPPVRVGQPVTLTAAVRDERGRPVTTGVATWRVTREPIDGPARRPAPRGKRFVRHGQRALDAAGRFDVTFTPEADAEDAAFAFPVLVDVASPRGAARNVEARVLAGALTRVKATIEPTARFFDAGERGAVTVRRAHLDGSPAPGQGRWRLVRLTAPADAPADPESKPADLATVLRDWTDGPTVAQGTAAHGADGVATLTLPATSAGAYRLRYATADATGAAFEAQHDLLFTAPTRALDLPTVFEVKQATVPVGGFVEVFVHTAPPGQHLILERWRGAERVDAVTWIAGQDPARLRFPVTDADRGGMTFDLVRVRDQRWSSARRVVDVPWTSKRLSVAIEAQPPTPDAGEATPWRVRVTGPDGAGVAAEVVASVDDARIERRAPHRVQTLEGLYPRQRRTPGLSATVPEVRVARPASKPGPRWLGWKRPQPPTLPVFARYPFQPPDTQPAVVDHAFAQTWGITLGVPPPTGAGARWSSGPLRAPGDHEGSFGFGLDLLLPPDVGETPLWLPHLTTAADGTATFSGPPPDAGRAWTVWVHALGPGLAGGMLQAEVRGAE